MWIGGRRTIIRKLSEFRLLLDILKNDLEIEKIKVISWILPYHIIISNMEYNRNGYVPF